MNTLQQKLIAKINQLNIDIASLEQSRKIHQLPIGDCMLSGDTARLVVACSINALSSQRENYKQQLQQEWRIYERV